MVSDGLGDGWNSRIETNDGAGMPDSRATLKPRENAPRQKCVIWSPNLTMEAK